MPCRDASVESTTSRMQTVEQPHCQMKETMHNMLHRTAVRTASSISPSRVAAMKFMPWDGMKSGYHH